ncbi:hypothetical protein ECHLIB_0847 [Ehrlichia chaffeensis str. Liberty]|uniref:hypothetical protein n=1 Tax=Ehrlichia chaffeensis TaxID=945 RepID=UPI000444B984|nr:hypothetical protein [Ehrlichia chaffeensis]AHX05899.1 hypothetical protein ECHJAX_0843 [Ehrlichia chaffeensis str. Jax]AHX06891.1 hypothetical protein ECHLIB_0847 [Ehrlichia chaffeensis str. Liberty]
MTNETNLTTNPTGALTTTQGTLSNITTPSSDTPEDMATTIFYSIILIVVFMIAVVKLFYPTRTDPYNNLLIDSETETETGYSDSDTDLDSEENIPLLEDAQLTLMDDREEGNTTSSINLTEVHVTNTHGRNTDTNDIESNNGLDDDDEIPLLLHGSLRLMNEEDDDVNPSVILTEVCTTNTQRSGSIHK